MRQFYISLFVVLLLGSSVHAQGTITTVAGNGAYGFAGDGGLATRARLALPLGLAFDSAGNLFFADSNNYRIRRVDADTGIITTVAGGGTTLGDNIPATAAQITRPIDVAVDAAGNLFFTEPYKFLIRRVDAGADGLVTGASDEIITAVAGGRGWTVHRGDGGPATSAGFGWLQKMLFDSAGNLFVADSNDRRIRRIDAGADGLVTGASDEIIKTVAGGKSSGSIGDGDPATQAILGYGTSGAVFDSAGNLLIADYGHGRIRRVDTGADGLITGARDEIISTVAGIGSCYGPGDGGPATSASLCGIRDVAVDLAGNLFIVENVPRPGRIRKVIPGADGLINGGLDEIITTYAQFPYPIRVAVNSDGDLHIADAELNRIVKIEAANTPVGSGVVVQPTDTTTGAPAPITVTFDNVIESGETTVTSYPPESGPPPPAGFRLGSSYYDITTTAAFSGSITVCINYTETGIGNESNLKLFHREGNRWVDRTVSLDTTTNTICATATSFSLFAIFEQTDFTGPETFDLFATPNPVAINNSVSLAATVSDAETGGVTVVLAEYNIDGGSTASMTGSYDQVTVNVSAVTPPFTGTGVYDICARGTDALDNVGDPACMLLPVYDPDGGFVTGGGWIDSPSGAYAADLTLTGKATFGFVSKYLKGANTPTGETEFQFRVADLNFHSASYDWLVVSGPKAQYKGSGAINGNGNYGFLLTATDGQQPGGGGADKFRIKIWDKATGSTIYDNVPGASDQLDGATPQVISGGSIVIQEP